MYPKTAFTALFHSLCCSSPYRFVHFLGRHRLSFPVTTTSPRALTLRGTVDAAQAGQTSTETKRAVS